MIKETDRDIRQVTEDVLAGGIEAEGDGMEFGIVVVVRLPGRQAEGEDVEPGFQGDVPVELIGQDGECLDALVVHTGLVDGCPVVQVPFLAETQIGIGFGPQTETVVIHHPVSDVGIETHGNGAYFLMAARRHAEEAERGTETGRQFLLEFPPEIGRDTEIESILERAGIRVIAVGCRKAEASADIERLGVAPEAGQR